MGSKAPLRWVVVLGKRGVHSVRDSVRSYFLLTLVFVVLKLEKVSIIGFDTVLL